MGEKKRAAVLLSDPAKAWVQQKIDDAIYRSVSHAFEALVREKMREEEKTKKRLKE